ncbi:MAG: hypothetical protein ACLGHQ_14050 [Acidimicrobiia bacterium]
MEWLIAIPSLDLPGDDECETISSAGAVEMFRHCALLGGAVPSDDNDDLRSVARICRLLDGLPLAIELAASRSRFMTVPQDPEESTIRTLMGPDRSRCLATSQGADEGKPWG